MRPRNAFRNSVFGASKLASAKTPLLNPYCRLQGNLDLISALTVHSVVGSHCFPRKEVLHVAATVDKTDEDKMNLPVDDIQDVFDAILQAGYGTCLVTRIPATSKSQIASDCNRNSKKLLRLRKHPLNLTCFHASFFPFRPLPSGPCETS